MGVAAVAILDVIAILIVSLTRGAGAGYSVVTAFVILMSTIPIGTPAVTASVLAVGAREMAKEESHCQQEQDCKELCAPSSHRALG